ncbi:NB-ARC domain-containing protein [Streptomyces rosealbus]
MPDAVKSWIVDREERQRAEDAVCGARATVGITTSLWGAGGFGKTTLAEMVCASPRVREHFKGGVYSFTIGREVRGRADIAARVAEITRFITGDTEQFPNPAEAGRHLGRLLDERKRTLLLLDDVWTDEQLEPFLHGGTHCVRLITTRVPSLLPAGTQTIQVDQMTLDQARTVLTWEIDGLPPLTTGALLDATGRWPLLLRLVNRQIKSHVDTGQDPAQAAEQILDQLRVHGPQGVDPTDATIDVDRPEERRRAIRATVEAATGLLPAGGMDLFAELAIFAEDEVVPLPLIARLWQSTAGLSERESRGLCAQLAGLSLLSLARDEGGRVSMHDVIRDYLLSAQEPTRLTALHAHLVDASANGIPNAVPPFAHQRAPYPAWWELTDGYLQDHLIEHLVAAGRTELAEAVTSDLRWVEDRLVRHGANAPQRDLSHVPTADAGSRAHSLAQVTHLLAPTDPAPLVLNTLYIRLAFLPPWQDLVTARVSALPARPLLVGLRPPPDLPGPALLATLTSSGSVNSVAISPDGTWLAASTSSDGGRRGEVELWDRASGRCTATLTGLGNEVNSMAISPEGTWVAISSGPSVALCDRANGQLTGHINDIAASVKAVAISPDGTWLATSSSGEDGLVRLWDRASGRCTATLIGHTDAVASVAISPDGTWLATGSRDGTVRLWEGASGRCTATLTGHTSWVASVAISADGTWLATGSRDGTVRLWEGASGRCTATLTGHTSWVASVAISADGTWLATGSGDETVRLWDRASGRCTATLTGHNDAVASVAISPDGTWLATGGQDGTVRLWDPAGTAPGTFLLTNSQPSGQMLSTRHATSDPTSLPIGRPSDFGSGAVAISPDGTWLATGSRDGTVRLWEGASGRCTATLTDHTAWVASVAISADGTWLATGSGDETVRLWDRASGRCTATLTGHNDAVASVAISPDGTWLAIGGMGPTVTLWDRGSGRCTATIRTGRQYADSVNAVAISPDGTWLATGSQDGTVQLWDRASEQCIGISASLGRKARSVAISPDGTWLATGCEDGTVHLWDRCEDDTVQLWDLAGDRPVTFAGPRGGLSSVAISTDGAWVASVGQSGEISIWDVSRRQVATLVRTDDSLAACAWVSSGQTFAAVGISGLHLFELRH